MKCATCGHNIAAWYPEGTWQWKHLNAFGAAVTDHIATPAQSWRCLICGTPTPAPLEHICPSSVERICPNCGTERTDYEGPGKHLPTCPACGSRLLPATAMLPAHARNVERWHDHGYFGDGCKVPLASLAAQLSDERSDEVEVMKGLCRLYFDIAAEVIGEDEVRRRRDERIPAYARGEHTS